MSRISNDHNERPTGRVLETFCYVLVESGGTQLCESTYVSAALLRRLYPNNHIVILCDESTEALLCSKQLPLSGLRVETQAVDIPPAFVGAAIRSRFLKTQIRLLIAGPLVFLDSDTVPLRRFDGLFKHGHAFAAVLDRNRENPRPHMPTWVEPIYRHYGWTFPIPYYFNSGVMFFADNAKIAELSYRWHERWKSVLLSHGKYQDQPTLNVLLHEMCVDQMVMPISYNAMVDSSVYFARDAKIVHHFFSGCGQAFDHESLLQHLINELTTNGKVDWGKYEGHLKRGDPWIHPTSSFYKEYITGHYHDAARILFRRLLGCRRGVK